MAFPKNLLINYDRKKNDNMKKYVHHLQFIKYL